MMAGHMDGCKHHFLGWSQESSSLGSDHFSSITFFPTLPQREVRRPSLLETDRMSSQQHSKALHFWFFLLPSVSPFHLSFYSDALFQLSFLRGLSLPPGHLGRASVHTHSRSPDRLRCGAWDHLQWEPHPTEWPTLPAQLTRRLTSFDFSITNPIFFLKAHLSTD